MVHKEGDSDSYRLARQQLKKAIRPVKQEFGERVEAASASWDSKEVWRTLNTLTNKGKCATTAPPLRPHR